MDAAERTAVRWARLDEKDPFAIVNATDSSGRRLQVWEIYLPEARRFHIAIEEFARPETLLDVQAP